jgi:prepilin-type N-terminal cleavage/methylation domain-containing protein
MRTRRTPRSPGFTLIELMVAVALSALVGLLIFNVFIQQTYSYRLQTDIGSMQQNLRIAIDMVGRDLSMSGWGTGWDGGTWGSMGQTAAPGVIAQGNSQYGLRIIEDFPTGSGHDAIEILMANPDRATWGWTSRDAAMDCATNQITFEPDSVASALQYTTGGLIQCWTPLFRGRPGSFLWQVSGGGGGGVVPVVANAQADFVSSCTDGLPERMMCAPPIWVAYYIDDDITDGIGIGSAEKPVLYYVPDVGASLSAGNTYPAADDIPVALGIEDMQFQLCMAGDGLDCEQPASWTTGLWLGAAQWQNVGSARVHLAARTLREDPTRSTASQRVDLDPTDGIVVSAAPDGYHRRVISTEVVVRNAVGTWQAVNAGW